MAGGEGLGGRARRRSGRREFAGRAAGEGQAAGGRGRRGGRGEESRGRRGGALFGNYMCLYEHDMLGSNMTFVQWK